MIRFFSRLTFGHFRRHRLEGILCLIGVALGVAVVVAMDAAVAACVRSFGGAVDSLAERSTHSIFAEQGQITDAAYIALLRKKLPMPLAPVIDRTVVLNGTAGQTATGRLIGVDVFSERSLRSFTKMQSSLDEPAFRRLLTQPNQIVLVDDLARQLGVKAGDALQITAGPRRATVDVVGIVALTGVARSQLTDVVIADLATAAELADSIGSIDRIDTLLHSDREQAVLSAALPPGLVLRSTQQRAQSLEQLIGSYRMNLNALSLMASFVAVFIVYNAMLISVQQRSASLGILRCLGASRWQLGGLYFSEATAFAIVGGIIGVLGGWALARLMVGYVSTTINDLYAAVRPGTVVLDQQMWTKGMATAVISCWVGAAAPLLRAAAVTPVNLLASVRRNNLLAKPIVLAILGAAMLAGSWGVYKLPGNSPVAGFVMALLIALGFALSCAWITQLICKAIDVFSRRWQLLPLQMAAAEVGRALGITAVAVAATMLAMSMNIGVRTMVASFRSSLSVWLEERFSADVFIAPELQINHKADATLDPGVAEWILRQPLARRVVANRLATISLGGKPTLVTATNVAATLERLPIKSHLSIPFDPLKDILISEPLAGRLKLSAGDSLQLETPSGNQTFLIHDVFFDFGNERGQIILELPVYASLWHDERINSLHVNLPTGTDRQAVARTWAQSLQREYPVVVNSFDGVKSEALRVFDRTFAITVVLTWLSGAVAFCGLTGSLLALSLARRKDYSILAAVGMSGSQTAAWVVGQGLLIAIVSALIAPLSGTLLADVLANVIQYRSFGWSIPTHPQPAFWTQNLWLACAAAIVAAIYPIYRLKQSPPAVSLRPG